jgi:hypothetical protein
VWKKAAYPTQATGDKRQAARGFSWLVRQQVPISVIYRGQSVGEHYADLLVENNLVLEIKVKNLAYFRM